MNKKRAPVLISLAILLLVAVELFSIFSSNNANEVVSIPDVKIDRSPVQADSLKEGDYISSPISLTGQARGNWYFEGSFPVVITDWDGIIIGEGYVKSKSDWMTDGFVPFEGVISFKKPNGIVVGTYNENGTIIFKKDNPSGLSANDAAVEIPIKFK